MLLKCISGKSGYWFTIGKNYTVRTEFIYFGKDPKYRKHLIVNDKAHEHIITEEEIDLYFEKVQIHRDNILEQLGL